METKSQPERMIFVHGYLDLYRLDPYEFRVLAHIARRGKCVAKVETIALICKMSVRKVQGVLKRLDELKLVVKTPRKGRTTEYTVAPIEAWKDPEYVPDLVNERAKVVEKMKSLNPSTQSGTNINFDDELELF